MTIAVILAVISGLLFAGIFIILFPNQTQDQMPIPRPSPSVLEQALWAMLGIGLVALIAISIVAVVLLINRIITKKKQFQPTPLPH
ncbi:MAG: hypothetical protein QXU99_08120 [Candidatus Bathyarchaeia archaeon]